MTIKQFRKAVALSHQQQIVRQRLLGSGPSHWRGLNSLSSALFNSLPMA